ncbi:hypothetical protein BGX28_006997 [Mortierella sp. GBA30]|nr:hypothetical protein BGX28_006997 [Mortierella sp. GBA30]
MEELKGLFGRGIQGKIIKRGDEGYHHHTYQYGSSSYKNDGLIAPLAVVYPIGDSDIQKVIEVAKEFGVGIAVRTGGHHYTGASSTYGKNIQLDLSNTYTDFEWVPNTRYSQVTLGISISLGKLLSRLEEAGRFVPTGQCSYVHLGGHVQTGGYGHLIRGFGLLADCVEKIRIINAKGHIKWIQRGIARDKDLFYAILGGSPGNFGVITDVTLNVYKDQDYPLSRGLHVRVEYSPELLKDLLDIMVEQDADDTATPADYDYSVTVVSGREVEGRPLGISVFAQWANLKGKGQVYDPALFNKIKKVLPTVWGPHDGIEYDDIEAPMSKLASHWVFPVAREFQLPYFKRAYISNSRSETLKKDGWAAWTVKRLDEIISKPESKCYVSAQFQYVGGKHSRFRLNDNAKDMSYSWRDSTYACTMDIFYDGEKEPKEKAELWVKKNDTEGMGHKDAKFSKQDRRLLWGSHDVDLHAAHKFYYDEDPIKYKRLSDIRQAFDPDRIFIANKFAVGPHQVSLDVPVTSKAASTQDVDVAHVIEP